MLHSSIYLLFADLANCNILAVRPDIFPNIYQFLVENIGLIINWTLKTKLFRQMSNRMKSAVKYTKHKSLFRFRRLRHNRASFCRTKHKRGVDGRGGLCTRIFGYSPVQRLFSLVRSKYGESNIYVEKIYIT